MMRVKRAGCLVGYLQVVLLLRLAHTLPPQARDVNSKAMVRIQLGKRMRQIVGIC